MRVLLRVRLRGWGVCGRIWGRGNDEIYLICFELYFELHVDIFDLDLDLDLKPSKLSRVRARVGSWSWRFTSGCSAFIHFLILEDGGSWEFIDQFNIHKEIILPRVDNRNKIQILSWNQVVWNYSSTDLISVFIACASYYDHHLP